MCVWHKGRLKQEKTENAHLVTHGKGCLGKGNGVCCKKKCKKLETTKVDNKDAILFYFFIFFIFSARTRETLRKSAPHIKVYLERKIISFI